MPKCVVIGAGLAGLSAAEDLIALGWTVHIVEARTRPGGRVHTEYDAFANGQYADAGAEWVDHSHLLVRGLVERFGLTLDGTTGPWTSTKRFLHFNGTIRPYDDVMATETGAQVDEFYAFISDCASRIEPDDPTTSSEAEALDELSVADLMARFTLNAEACLGITRHMQGEFACEPSGISVLFVAQQEALFTHMNGATQGWSRRLKGGLSQLPTLMADALAGVITYGAVVVAVAEDENGVTVMIHDGRVIQADAVVITAPLTALRSVTFSPPLPESLDGAIQRLGMGTITKVFGQYDEKVWVAAGLDAYIQTDLPMQRVYEPTSMQSGTSGILTAYIGGDHGAEVASQTAEQRQNDVVQQIDSIVPGAINHLIASSSQAWPGDPYARGAYAVYGPGQVMKYWRVLREPHGRVTFAGEHTAITTGYMEGALESGHRAAHQTHNLWA